MRNEISQATISRLPLYLRTLGFAEAEGTEIISSDEFGRRLNITPEQIRKDLASFGQFGKKGVGYYVTELKNRIAKILGFENNWNVAIVGMGHLGDALAHYKKIPELGFNLVALFDVDKKRIGSKVNGIDVSDVANLKEKLAELNVQIVIIAVPTEAAQEIVDALEGTTVRGIWNFAPINVQAPKGIRIVHEDLTVGLGSLSYHISQNWNPEG